ncbi:MAG: TlpA family protein disulfide reductase [Trueperaceae bacterium]|nr:TlpA family protein disulfide reductase [Trueperaceae bacterium]
MRRVLVTTAVVGSLAALFVFGLLRGHPDRDIPSNLLGRTAPSFELPLYEHYTAEYGTVLSLAEERGRPMIINFWASWCGPCYDEAPHLERIWNRYRDDVLVIGVQTQDRDARAAGRAFIDQFGLSFPNVHDNDSRVSITYGLFGVPETFFVRADGTVQYKHAGPVTESMMVEQIEAMLR